MTISLDPAASSVALLALAATGYFGWRQMQLQKRVTAIEEERRAEERRSLASADVTARCMPKNEPFNLRVFVFLKNRGLAPAHNVTIFFPEQNNALRPGKLKNPAALPIPVLNSGEERGIELDTIPAGESAVDVVLEWQDEERPKKRPAWLSWVEWTPGPTPQG